MTAAMSTRPVMTENVMYFEPNDPEDPSDATKGLTRESSHNHILGRDAIGTQAAVGPFQTYDHPFGKGYEFGKISSHWDFYTDDIWSLILGNPISSFIMGLLFAGNKGVNAKLKGIKEKRQYRLQNVYDAIKGIADADNESLKAQKEKEAKIGWYKLLGEYEPEEAAKALASEGAYDLATEFLEKAYEDADDEDEDDLEELSNERDILKAKYEIDDYTKKLENPDIDLPDGTKISRELWESLKSEDRGKYLGLHSGLKTGTTAPSGAPVSLDPYIGLKAGEIKKDEVGEYAFQFLAKVCPVLKDLEELKEWRQQYEANIAGREAKRK